MATLVNTSIILDIRREKKDGTYPVKLRITHERKQKYFYTPFNLTKVDFDDLMTKQRLSEIQKGIKKGINDCESKAIGIIKALPIFTFLKFDELYFENRDANKTVKFAFDKYISELKDERRIGTASSYECAKRSIEGFEKGIKFADVTPAFLKKYEAWMLSKGNSKTTVGIYLRSLRTLFNRADIDKSLYPFGEGQKKYSIPTGRNIKKALTLEEIGKIFNYEAPPKSMAEMAKDYWIFIYLCNGLNVKDLCLLKHKNIQGDILTFERAKTIRTKNNGEKIIVSLKPHAKAIISKWGQLSINPETYVFPHLQKGMTDQREREIIQQLIKNINKYMKRITREQGIDKKATTMYARHSFATVLRNSGASTEFIQDAFKHSSPTVTQNYLAGFEQETIHKTTDALTNFEQRKQA